MAKKKKAKKKGSTYSTYLLADCGSSYTSVLLIDVVDGIYRFVGMGKALSTAGAPWYDISHGIQHAIVKLEEKVGRPILTSEGAIIKPTQADGSGVDYIGMTASVGKPLKTMVFGLLDDISLATARWAVRSTYTEEVGYFSLKEINKEKVVTHAIAAQEPDLIFISGGIDGGATQLMTRLINVVSLGVNMLAREQQPHLIYAGNSSMHAHAKQQLADVAHLYIIDNVRPKIEEPAPEQAISAIAELYQETSMKEIPGLEGVAKWLDFPVLPTIESTVTMLEYLAQQIESRIYAVDLGSDSATFITADPDTVQISISANLGMGRPLAELMDKINLSEIAKWLPIAVTPAQLRNYILNKSIHPHLVPMSEEDLRFEQAIARVVLRLVVADAQASWGWDSTKPMPPGRLLIVRGQTLTNAPRPAQTVLMLLDALQPTGIFAIAMDPYGILPALGVMARRAPMASIQVLEGGALVDLAWVVVPTGEGNPDEPLLTVEMNSPTAGKLKIEVMAGTLEEVPLRFGEEAELLLTPAWGVDVGYGSGRSHRLTITGGGLGLVIDARGRPLELPLDSNERRDQLQKWLWDMGG